MEPGQCHSGMVSARRASLLLPARAKYPTMSRAPTTLLLLAALTLIGCATPAAPATHGTLSNLSRVEEEAPTLCEHHVPQKVCTRCHPDLEDRFKSVGDWCPEHGIPESQCLLCHPTLTFTPLPRLPPNADVQTLSSQGEDVPSLFAKFAPSKVTVFDFYADWCAPCRAVDEHVHSLLQRRTDVALRRINVVSWDSPVAKANLKDVPTLPYLVVVDQTGRRIGVVSGLDLPALDKLIAQAAPPANP